MVGILFFMTQLSFGQVGKAFSPRLTGGNIRIKGDVVFVGNSMMSATTYPNLAGGAPDPRNVLPVFSPSDPNGTPTNLAALTAEANKNFNVLTNNNGLNQEYTDIDSDPTTFASSSAELKINQSCKRIVYAGLYWTAIYPYERSTNSGSNTVGTPRLNDWNRIKFKVPGAANYIDIVADNNPDAVGDEDDIIYDDNAAPAGSKMPNTPYACYKNVTSILQNLTEPNGNYFAANIRAAKGKKSSGSMAGWTLVIIYESPTLPSRYISTFDGFVGITSALRNIDFTVNGFRTLPAPLPVRATIGVATQEGEARLFGDDLLIRANSRPTFTFVNNSRNPLNNVFNSSITVPTTTTPFSANVDTRVPNSLNTLGFDMDLINVNNPNNGVIPNGETGATYRLTSTSDTYAAYVTTFAVDVIEPEIVLTKVVKNSAGVDIGNQNVTLGDYLNYEIGFRNVGNDDADQFTIKDVLPINILFDPNSIVIPNGSGITYTYTPATRTLIFTIPNNIVKINGNQWIIKFGVQVVPNCNDLSDACSDRIQNQAFATYRGITNPSIITDDPSISVFGNCNLAVAAPTNFLVGVDGCKYSKKYQLCGSSVAISAANGYNKYEWSSSPFVNGVATGPIIGTTQTITVTNVGTYYVRNTALAPCISIDETVTVEPFGTTVVNPVTIPTADEIVICPNNGKPLPNIYLCGANVKRYIRTGITDTTDIVWEKSSCVLVPNTLCADETNTCTWTQVATGADYNVGDQGQYRITLRYANGCFNRYFFNVYENNLTPTATSRDIICTTNGEIVVGTPAAGSGYEYSLDGTTYQASNILPITTPNIYTVYIRSTANLANACVFTIPGIQIRKRDFTVTTTINNPLCNGGKGSVKLAANDVRAQYFFEIFNASGVSVSKVGPVIPNDYTFLNLNPGAYTVSVKTEDGCDYTGTINLVEPDVLTATAAITKPITCENGEITVTPVGGTGPFTYFVNSTTDFQGSPIIDIATPGQYNIKVVDFNNCEFTLAPITINANPKPEYTVGGTNVLCYGANTGAITFNVTNANGYTLAYSIDNGATYVANGTFSNLAPSTYTPILKYTLSGVDCFETQPDIVIAEPAAALTASAGVSELAGCGPAREGKVRITNPQGGTPFAGPNPYQFSFDNQATWTTVNDAYKAPGTYTLYVRDANGCIFSAPVILDPEPAEPVIDATPQIDFNCDGSATSTVTVANPPNTSYTYEYYLDNVINTNVPNNVFLNVSSGSHSIRVDYKLNSVPTPSNLLFENFGYGDDTTSPGINTAFYCFERQVVATQCRNSTAINDGDYSVTSFIVNPFGAWVQPGDHTTPTVPPTPKGRSLVVNIGDQIATSDILYQKVINDIIPNQPINFELYAMNLLRTGNTQVNADLRVALVDASGTEISWFATGEIPKTQTWEQYPKTPVTLNPGNNTTLRFIIRSNKRATDGNDVAIDDIKVYQLPKTCISSKSFPLNIDPGKAFNAQITGQKNVTCNGLTNGEFTISATNFDTTTGYQYSTNNGANWSVALFTSPVTVSNLAGNLYKVIVRPVGSAVAACAKPFDVTISAPSAVTLSASVTKLATCTTGATITAIGGGGTPTYQYELRQSNGTTVVTAFDNNGGEFTDVPTGSYTVFVRDANLCVIPTGVPVTVSAVPTLAAALATTTDYCYTTANPATLDVTVTGGVGPYTYKLNSNAAVSSAATTYSFTNVAPGPHTIVVTDSNNCTATISSIVIAPQLGFTVSLINDLTCLADASIGNPVVSGGNGTPYTYTVSRNSGAASTVTSFPYTATLAGTYVFTVYDSRGCPATSNTITVTAKTTPVASPIKTDITCNNANDGTITITASAGFTSAYTYAIKLSTASTYTTQTTNVFTGLAAGVYDVKVIDSKGCESVVVQVTIANPSIVTASIGATDIGCSPTGTVPAVVTVTASGGTGTLQYSFNGNPFTTTNTFSTTTATPVNALVRDANNCQIGPLSITIAAPEQFTGITITDFGWDCRTSPAGGHVNIAGTGVSAPKRYSIISGPVGFDATENSDGEFKALAPGAYVFQVRDTKTNCTLTRSYTVSGTPDIVAGGSVTSPILCFGNLGTIQFTVSGLNGHRYDYVVTNTAGTTVDSNNNQSAPTITIANLPATGYTIVVKDRTTDCTATYTINLTQPAAAIAINTAVATNVNCNNDVSQISVTASGGTPNYTYAYRVAGSTTTLTYASGNVLNIDTTNGTVLSWDVYVKDANGCTTSRTVTVISDALPAITSVTVPNQCSASGSTFTITATPSVTSLTPITFDLSATGSFTNTTGVFTVAAGTYTVYIKDKNGCVVAAPAPTEVYAQLTASAAVTKTLDCSTSPDAVITTTITGGKAPFTYTVQKGTGTPVSGGPASASLTFTTSVSNANADTYTFVITDANSCQTTTSATVSPITNPSVAPTPTQVSCNGGTDGSVTLVGSGGSGGYQYNFNNLGFSATATYSGLSANIAYAYQVRDSKGCVSTIGSITLTQPTAVSFTVVAAPFSCNSTTNASQSTTIIVTPGGGTGTYSYSYDNGGTFVNNATRVVNDNGLTQTFNIIVRDANGCLSPMQAIVLAPLNKPTDLTFTNAAVTCTATTTTVTVTATNGVGALSFLITGTNSGTAASNFGPITTAGSSVAANFPNLLPGNYTFRVTDANGCFYTESHTVAPVTPIAVTATKLTDVDCFGSTTGSARFTVSGFSSSGNYNITVSSTPASLPYTLSPSGDVRTLTGLVAGTYTFSVTDITTGCTDSKSVTITQPTAALAITNATATNVFCSNDNSQITVTATGGTTNYGYAAVLSGASAPTVFGTSSVITVDTNSGANLVWDVYVRDAKGCTTLAFPVTIINNGSPAVTASVTNQCGASGSSFQIVAVGSGGLAPYIYTINTGLAPSPANTFTVAAGTYTITATDANGCPATTTVTVNQALTATAIVTKDITCSLPQEATIKVDVLGGLAPFGYRVKIGAGTYTGSPIPFAGTTFTYTASGTTGSTYEFEITDANGIPCTALTNVVTTNTTVTVTASETHVSPTCNGFTDGSIRLTATAGVAPFTYAIASSPSVPTSFGSANVFGGLAAGTYNYIVRDAKGCDATGSITLINPPAIAVNIVTNAIQCNTNTPGSFDVNVTSGGTAPYVYRLYDNAFTQIATFTEASAAATPVHSFTGLNFGDYYITVVDANGCEFKSPKIRIETPPFLQQSFLVDSNNCATGVDVEVTTSGGIGPFRYSIFGQPLTETAPLASNVYTFTGLLHGVTYFFQVKDSFNCISIKEFTTPPPPSTINITGTTSTNVTCNGTANGTLAFTVQNFDASVTSINYEVLNALTLLPLPTPIVGTLTGAAGGPFSGNITTLPAGNYVLKVTEATGTLCSAAYTFQITQPAQPLTSSVTSNVPANCNSGALVTLTTTGGTGPYQYAYAVAPTVPSSFASGNVLTLDPGVAGTDLNWNIIVRDVNGCTFPLSVTIAKDPTPVITLSVVDKCVAQGTFGILVTETTAGTGAYSISVDGGAFASIPSLPHTVTGLNSGPHTIIIKDANGCTDTETITIAAPLVATPAITALPTCANNDGVITMSGAGGTGTYTYTISPSPVSVVINNTTGVISGLPANTYTITMADSATPTNCTTTAVVTLGAPTPVTFTPATTPALCVGDNNGSITVTLLAGNNNPSYTYEIIAGPQLAVAQSSNIFLGLLPGTYTVRVNSGRGCSTDDTNVIVAPATPLTASAAFPANTTCSTSTVITVTAGGGTGSGYLYNFNGLGYTSDPTYTVNDNGSIQTISYRVKDANGCETLLQTIDVNPLNKPTDLNFVVSTAPTCPAPTTGVTVTATNGVGALTFRIIQFNGAPTALYPPQITAGFAVSAVFNNLPVGDYMFQVTDTFGCTYQESYTVAPVIPIAIVGAVINDISCDVANGTTNNGSASFTVTGFSASGNYSISVTSVPAALPFTQSAAADVITLAGLSAGTYTVTVTDTTTGCTEDDAVTITLPAPIMFTATASKVFCSQDVSTITVSAVTGGTGTYTYAVVAGGPTAPAVGAYSTSPILTVDTNLTALSWDVYVKDANGCIAIQNVSVVSDAAPTIVAPAAQCYVGSPLTVDLSPNTITTTYNGTKSYTVNGSVSTANPIFTAPGLYVLGIKDDNGCEAFVNYTIQPQLTLQANMTQDLTCPNPASITLVPAGGTTSYTTFEVDNGTGYAVAANPYTTIISGTYKFRVTDSQGCQAESQDIIITPNTTPTAIAAPKDVSCIGSLDGTITLTPSGGNIAYEYSLNGGAYQASNVFSGLGVNTYTILVRDAKLCVSAPITVSIGQPAPLTATAVVTPFGCDTANAPLDAIVTITPVGGTTGYSYSFDNGATYQASASFSVNTAQTITYVVRDANGCEVTGTADVLPYTPPTDMDLTATPIYCNTPGTVATVTVNSVTAGVGPFVFEIIAPATAVTPPSAPSAAPFSFATLAPDTYVIRVTDANGCSTTKTIIVEEADKIAATTQVINNVYCNSDSTGTIEFTVSNYIVPANYNFSLSPSAGTMTQLGDVIRYTGVPAGPYTFTVNDLTSGCQAIVPISVSQPLLALDFSTTATNINCNNDTATITVAAIDGTPTYKYVVLQSPSSAPALTAYGLSNQLTVDTNGGTNMVWDVYVMDANGCIDSDSVTIILDPNPSNITVAPFSECPDPINGTYTFTINTPIGVGPFEYSIGGGFQTSPTFVVNAPGSYDVTVKDVNGCSTTAAALVVIRQPLILTPTVTTPVSCTTNDGVVSVSTTGGSGTYEYRIDSGVYPMTTPFAGLASGAHTVYVRDTTTGCEVSATITLQAPTLITGFALTTTPVICNGGFDGTITATMNTPAPGVNDNPVYTYTLTGTSITGAAVNVGPQTSSLFSGLEASDVNGYTVVVTSARDCDDTKTIVVTQPNPIVVPTIVPVPFACTSGNTGNLATISVTGVTGGSGTYLNYEFIKVGTPNTVVQFGNSNVYTEANLSGGSYIVNVYDNKGCMGTSTAAITINPYIQLDQVNVNVTRAITCTNLEDIAVSVSAIGGTPANLQFTVQDVTYDNSVPPIATKGAVYNLPPVSIVGGVATFTNLPVGNYEITVRNLDTNCEIIGVHYVNEPNTFDLTIDNIVDVTCFGGTNGSARVTLIDRVPTPIDNAGPFDYTVYDIANPLAPVVVVPTTNSPTFGPITLTNLRAGTFMITATLTNTPFCTVSKNFTITGPTAILAISETHTAITCVTGNNDGSISATATGGWPGGYEFQLERGATVVTPWSAISSFNALTAGTYTVKVRDPKLCEVFTTVLLNNPTPIAFTATPSTTLLTCIRDTNASITVSVPTGGQGSNYLYTLNTTSATPMLSSGPQTGNVFNNLGAGTYTVTVTDGWGCGTTSAPIVIGEPTEVVASLVLASSQTCTVLSTITLSATGGTGTYTYSADGTFTPTGSLLTYGTFATSTTILNVPVGVYHYYVRDANGCVSIVSNDIKIDPLPTLAVVLDVVNAKINCNGDTSGVIVAVATGGLGNYVYTLLNGSGTPIVPAPTQLTPGRFTNLAASTYQVRVDSQDCNVISTGTVTITEPLLPVSATTVVTPVTCNGAANGIINVTASGGTGVIKYAISPRLDQFFDTGLFDQLAPDTYQIIVQDENGCFILLSETITEPQPIFVNTVAGSEVQELCAGDNNAAFDVNITGGVMPYSVTLDDINGTYVTGTATQNVFNFAGLTGGDHTVYIRDFNGCTAEWIVSLDESVNLDPKATVAYGCDNNSPSSTVTVTVDASITNPADVDYALDGSAVFQASNIFSNLTPGLHTITARHTNGCEKTTVQFEVLGFTPLTLTLADGGLNEIVATATGGAGNYQYSFDGGNTFDTNNKLIYYRSGDYTVIVRDANGCEATATRFFEFIDIKIPNVFTPNGDGNNDTWTPTNTINYKDLTISIFDRYGRKVDTLREGQGWDGKYNGLELPTGDYWYILKLKNVQDDREFVGHFTLMR